LILLYRVRSDHEQLEEAIRYSRQDDKPGESSQQHNINMEKKGKGNICVVTVKVLVIMLVVVSIRNVRIRTFY